jgi:pimeloyl-ACP methyl ester carboxylesterase
VNEQKTRFEVMLADRPVAISVREWRIGKPKGRVICLHGLGVNGAEYAPMAEGLNKAGFDVLAPDWMGHGDSDYLSNLEDYDWTNYVKCLTAIVRHHHGPVTHYVGTSWGGAILLMFLLSLRVRPQSAIFVDVPIRTAPETTRHGEILGRQVGQSFASAAEGNAFLAQLRPLLVEVPAKYKAYLDQERYRAEGDRLIFSFDPLAIGRLSGSASWKYNYFGELKRFSFDTLFLYGAASPHRWPPDYVALAQKSPLITYNGDMKGGHPPMLLFEEQFGPIVDYIKKKTPAR